MTKKNYFLEVPVDVYSFRVIAFIGDPNSFREKSEPLFDNQTEWIDTLRGADDCGGFCIGMRDDKGDFELIFINTDIPKHRFEEVIWHESLHAALDILCGLGGNVNLHEQEPVAYLQGFIASEIIKKHKEAQKLTAEERENLSQTVSEASSKAKTNSDCSKSFGRVLERSRAHILPRHSLRGH